MRHDALIDAMIELFSQDAKRINHFLKVYAFAQTIALQEKVNAELQDIIEAVAICHDIGIRISEKKYGNCTYEMQQTEGPP
ncbi:MAG: HD domain-containing protein, partial [Sphaerochaetaceae bacterium]|nr:HD domain-containing protein [Sphaerochaetaceae bacterium]